MDRARDGPGHHLAQARRARPAQRERAGCHASCEIQAEIAATQLELEAASLLIAERAQELTSADGATVNLLDGDELVAQAVVGSTTGPARISVPLLHDGRNVGSLSVTKEAVTDEDRGTLELLAVILSSAVSATAEREARREQIEALARFETIFECAPIGIGLVSFGGRLRQTNAVMRDISGRSAEELASRSLLEYTVPEDVPEVARLLHGHAPGRARLYRHEHRLYAKNGDVVWVDSATALLRDANGKPQGAVSMAQNITHRRAAEEQLRQSQKMEAIGRLAGGSRTTSTTCSPRFSATPSCAQTTSRRPTRARALRAPRSRARRAAAT